MATDTRGGVAMNRKHSCVVCAFPSSCVCERSIFGCYDTSFALLDAEEVSE